MCREVYLYKNEGTVLEEMGVLEKNKTCEITELPKGKRVLRCTWVFTIKYKANSTPKRKKPRLVAKGFTQTFGIYHMKIFAPVAKLNAIRVLANLDWPLHQLDIKNAFLNGDVTEEIYIFPPPRFEKKAGSKGLSAEKVSMWPQAIRKGTV